MLDKDILTLLFEASLKSRLLREWQKSSSAGADTLSEREMLSLEMIQAYSPVGQRALSKVFDISPGAASHLVNQLCALGLVERPERKGPRESLLKLTEKGKHFLDDIKKIAAQRYAYLFADCNEPDFEILRGILKKINEATDRKVLESVFGRTDITDLPREQMRRRSPRLKG